MKGITIFNFAMISWFHAEIRKVTQSDIEKPTIFCERQPEGSHIIVGSMHDSLKVLFFLCHKLFFELRDIYERAEHIQDGYAGDVNLEDLENYALFVSDRCDFLENVLLNELCEQFPDVVHYSSVALGPRYEVYVFNDAGDDADTSEDCDGAGDGDARDAQVMKLH